MEKTKSLLNRIFYPEPKIEPQWKEEQRFEAVVAFVGRIPFRKTIMVAYHILLIVTFGILNLFTGDNLSVAEGKPVFKIGCSNALMGNGCGFNAQNCDPFTASFVAKCPAKCLMKRAWTPIFVGKQAIQYSSYVVGDEFYRGDSWICQAAIHQGIISDDHGGCVVVEMKPSNGERFSNSTKNGISSINFDSTYPGVLSLRKPDTFFACADMTTPAVIVFALILAFFPLLGPSKFHFFSTITVWVFAFWGFLSADVTTSDHSVSDMMGQLLPYIAVMFSLYKIFLEDFFPEPNQYPVEFIVLFLGGLWVGLYLDFLFELLPPLPPMSFDSEMFRNPSGVVVLISVLIFIGALVFYYLYKQRQQHQMVNLLLSYGPGFPIYILFRYYFQLVFHLHHYISALLLIPPVMVKNYLSLFLVPVLLGWYAQGVIKYGFDSPFDTVQGARILNGRTLGTNSVIWTVNATTIQNGRLSWTYPISEALNLTDLYPGSTTKSIVDGAPTSYSLFLNDVEVYRGKQASWNFTSDRDRSIQPDPNIMYYARVAPVIGGAVLDYGKPLEFQIGTGSFQEYPAFRN
jgi:hypothetical protein